MKKLRKLKKNAKALSPVVASIILIAVTVAVSIAVAAWMGALTVGFMGSSSITITSTTFSGTSGAAGNTIELALKNTGTKSVTVAQVKVNNALVSYNATTLDAGDTSTMQITSAGWADGNTYKFDLFDNSGQAVGSYQAVAPS
jgi:flagellin-like protein